MRPLNVLVWHQHGSYLYYLTQGPHNYYLPAAPSRTGHYVGRWGHIPWGDNVFDVPVESLKTLKLDCIVFQSPQQYLVDQRRYLTAEQQRLPKIYLEHDPPLDHPTEHRHVAADDDLLLVHVTHFNRLMWDSGRAPTRVIEHGVKPAQGVVYTGELERGIVVVNNIGRRGRRVGPDIYADARRLVPLDLVGMGTESVEGGLGEVIHARLPAFEARYRFFFNPIRYTSLNLAVCEAMTLGLPVVGLATTEMAMAVPNGEAGYVDTRLDTLIDRMKELVRDRGLAARLGEGARRYAAERFGLARFLRDWNDAFSEVTRCLHSARSP